MSGVSELHPEHLLDREIAGELDEAERARLEEHVARCAACKLERRARADFAAELAEEPEINLTELFSGDRPPTRVVPPPARVSRFAWLFAAAIFLLVVSAVASSGVGRTVWAPIFVREAPERTVVVNGPPPKERRYPPPPQNVQATPLTVTGDPPAPAPPPAIEETAASLFDQESEARRAGDYDRAVALHARLVTKFPASREAQVSRVTIARVLLDRGDPASALAGFDAYLQNGSGELGEDAMIGRATALERLHRDDDARRAWQAFLAAYPGSPYAAHARSRVEPSKEHR